MQSTHKKSHLDCFWGSLGVICAKAIWFESSARIWDIKAARTPCSLSRPFNPSDMVAKGHLKCVLWINAHANVASDILQHGRWEPILTTLSEYFLMASNHVESTQSTGDLPINTPKFIYVLFSPRLISNINAFDKSSPQTFADFGPCLFCANIFVAIAQWWSSQKS